MTIGFDLDKIFIDTPPFIPNSVIQRMYRKKANGVLLYRIPSRPEQLFRRVTHMPLLRPPIQNNLEFLRNIPKEGNKLYLISSRYKFLESATNQLVKAYELDKIFDKLYFNYENKQPHIFKNEVLKKLKLDMYIDDDLALINHVAKDNPKTKFFWLETDGRTNVSNLHHPLEANVTPIKKLATIFT
jgi:hypothetical protein